VKQAEMFAAIREEWDIPRDDTLQLRDYPTLARAIQFVFDRRPDLAPGATAGASASAPETPVPGTEEEHTQEIPTAATSVHRRVPAAMLLPALDLCKKTDVRLQKGSRLVVMADRGGVGKALGQRLERLGAEVLLLEANLDAEEVVPRLEEWKRDGEVQGMYWLPAHDAYGVASSAGPAEGVSRNVSARYRSFEGSVPPGISCPVPRYCEQASIKGIAAAIHTRLIGLLQQIPRMSLPGQDGCSTKQRSGHERGTRSLRRPRPSRYRTRQERGFARQGGRPHRPGECCRPDRPCRS
jgi:hypothetical protein